jgi:heptosyltransferase-1
VKVLIVRLSAIGDVVQGIPALVALKETFPDWSICWLVEETSAPLLENHPCLTHLFVWKRRTEGWGGVLRTLARVRAEKFDAAIDLQGLLKSAVWTAMSGARRRIGHKKTREGADLFLNEYVGDRPVFDPNFPLIQRYLEPACHLGADPAKARFILPPVARSVCESVDDLLSGVDRSRPLVALCPRSHWTTKDWPADRWAGVARSLREKAQVVVIGAAGDDATASAIARDARGCFNLAGRTTLPELIEIFRRCRCVAGADTGPVHFANATGVPKIVMIFGSTSFRRSGPWSSDPSRRRDHISISRQLDCQPCFDRACRFGHLNCLKEISEKEVLEKILERIA